MSDRDCRAELCPMWDGESCPCQAFELDPDDPPTGGVFETVTSTGDAATRARELLAAATPRPWRGEWVPDDDWIAVYGQPYGVYVCPEVCTLTDDADAELIAAAPTLLAELAAEVERLQAALHLRDTTPRPPENAMWHWSLISNSDYTKVCAENDRLRALTTVDDAMVERAAREIELHAPSYRPINWPDDHRELARVALEAALGVES